MIGLLDRLVSIESPADHPLGCHAVQDVVGAEFAALGARLDRHTAANGTPVLLARWGRQERPVLVLGHVDTVFGVGELARRPFTVHDGRARGPGVFDMKAGLVQLVEALRQLLPRTPEPDLTVLLNADEELGSPGSEPFLVAEAERSACALVLEPGGPGGAMKTARKGIGFYDVEVTGVAAHPGLDFDRGVNAITELAAQLGELAGFSGLDEGTTVNLGTVRGGTGRNVVAARATAQLETRFWTAEAGERVDAAVRARTPHHPDAKITVTGGVHRGPLHRGPGAARLAELARACAAADGWEPGELAVGGVSDANVVSALGVPTVDGLGAEGGGAHGPDEYVLVGTMPRRARWLAAVLARLTDRPHEVGEAE
ncbi:M20 family metallopeptidase [Amycolatopsis sp. 195334CR]|uniref:M20 family metallopeptidase n=1 Tax=Amycolatopsis sp. 195334CR TaxID=2814588 RepID=UPI001A8D5EEE|nr:M20 family metallopeptidase [Amycolatopsis sp. 195334CR]MBN6042093.1 M20 family metallopeptidase [Amycolatopsis sp. 195334CR]